MILEGIVTTLELGRHAQRGTDGPRGRSGGRHAPLRPPAVPDLDDVRQPQGARRGRAARHGRRAAAGPGGDRRADRALPGHSAGERGGRRDPGGRLPLSTSSGSSSSTTATIGPGSWPRPSPRDATATSSASTGRSTRCSRRRSWRRARPGCRSAISCSNSASSRCWSARPAGPAELAAFTLLYEFLREAAVQQGVDPDLRPTPP